MDYHQNARTTVPIRAELAKRVIEEGVTLKLAAASFSVSAKTAAKWVRRYWKGGAQALWDRSSRPRRCYRQASASLMKVLDLLMLRWNGWRTAHELRLSRATVSRILRRNGMNRLRSLDPPPPVVPYEHERTGDLIHFDIKRLARIVKPGTASTATARRRPAARATNTFTSCIEGTCSIYLRILRIIDASYVMSKRLPQSTRPIGRRL